MRGSLRVYHAPFAGKRFLIDLFGAWLRSVVQGHFNYYAVPGNLDSLNTFRHRLSRLWQRTLVRRSQRGGFSWAKMRKLIAYWLPEPCVLHPYPEQRFAATHPR